VKADDPDLNNSLGTVFAQSSDLPRAQEYLERALRLRPQFPEALNNLGMLYAILGKNQEAVSQFLECIRAAPEFDQPYLNLASFYIRMNQKMKAQDILRALLQQHPDHLQAKKVLEAISH
jgi:Flp pilus assembly protein TadD